MGLKDLVPDEKKSDGKSKSRSSSDDDTVRIQGPGEKYKEFPEEQWEKIQRVIRNEMGLNSNEVVHNKPAAETYKIVHEAALILAEESTPEEEGYDPTRCDICGKAVHDGVKVGGLTVHANHTAGQINNVLNENN